MKTSFSGIADEELNKIFGEVEGEGLGGQELANKTLKEFYTQTITMKYFLISTGKYGEFQAWLKRFRKQFPNAERAIQDNLELDTVQDNLELDTVED